MKTLEQIKKEKNFKANVKGFVIDPEGFPKWWLLKRLADEHLELEEIFDIENNNQSEEYLDDLVMDELADMSNFIDFLATKIIVNYPDRYNPEEVEG